MNPAEEAAKRILKREATLGQLAYERYHLSKQIEGVQKRITEIDLEIGAVEVAMRTDEQARRDFNTYVAIKEAAVSLEDLMTAASTGENLETPSGAVLEPEIHNGG